MSESFCPECPSPIDVPEAQDYPEKCSICDAHLPAPAMPPTTSQADEDSSQSAAVHICRLCGASNPADGCVCSVCREPFKRPVARHEGLQLRTLPWALQLAAAIYRVNLGRILPAVVMLGILYSITNSLYAYAFIWSGSSSWDWMLTGSYWAYRGVYLLYLAAILSIGLSASRVAWLCCTGRGVTPGDVFQRPRGVILLVALCFVWSEAGNLLLDEMRHQKAIEHTNQAAALLLLKLAVDVLIYLIVVLMSFALCRAGQKPTRALATLVEPIRENWPALLALYLLSRLISAGSLVSLYISPWFEYYSLALFGVMVVKAVIAPYLWLLWCVAYLYAANRFDEITLRDTRGTPSVDRRFQAE